MNSKFTYIDDTHLVNFTSTSLNKKVGHVFIFNKGYIFYWDLNEFLTIIFRLKCDRIYNIGPNVQKPHVNIPDRYETNFYYPSHCNNHIFQNWLWLNEFELYILIMHIRYWRYRNVTDNELKRIPEINSPRDYHVRAFLWRWTLSLGNRQ